MIAISSRILVYPGPVSPMRPDRAVAADGRDVISSRRPAGRTQTTASFMPLADKAKIGRGRPDDDLLQSHRHAPGPERIGRTLARSGIAGHRAGRRGVALC